MSAVFDPVAAEAAWQDGKVILVNAIETYPNPMDPPRDINGRIIRGFTIDKLLKGVYDDQLAELADRFKQFENGGVKIDHSAAA